LQAALLVVTKTLDKVMTGEISINDLIVSKILRQDLYKYRSLFPHMSAALQLTEAGVTLARGDTIQYIYTDAAHSNPLRRYKYICTLIDTIIVLCLQDNFVKKSMMHAHGDYKST
jgi:DNA polymerase elongation subunit (family B)